MIIVFSSSILTRESAEWGRVFTDEDIRKAARKAVHHAGVHHSTPTTKILGGASGGGLLIKVDLTTKGGAGRSLFLLRSSSGMIAPLIVRPKASKFGKNLAPENPLYEHEVHLALHYLATDLTNGNYRVEEV